MLCRRLVGLSAFALLGTVVAPARAQVLDRTGDTSLRCVDIVSGDVRADLTTLTATIQLAADFCPKATYSFQLHVVTRSHHWKKGDHRDWEDDDDKITFETTFDKRGAPRTKGLPGLDARVDRATRTIVWRAPLSKLTHSKRTMPVRAEARFRTERDSKKDRLPDEGTLDFTFGGATTAIIGPAGGTVVVDDAGSSVRGASLTIPPGALSEPHTFSVQPSSDSPLLVVSVGW